MPEEFKLLTEWIERLGLHDWKIILTDKCKPEELDETADGDVEYVESTKCAKIRIIDPEHRKPALREFDFEECLVHELLHCKLSILTKNDDWDTGIRGRVLHQIVDDLARAFIDAKRFNGE